MNSYFHNYINHSPSKLIAFVLVITCTQIFALLFTTVPSLQAAPLLQGTATCNGTIPIDGAITGGSAL